MALVPADSSVQQESRLERLARLQDSDQGVFVLAVHAFLDAFKEEFGMGELHDSVALLT